MRVRVTPGGVVGGSASVPGDKSIAHRWLLLAAIADGRSELAGLPPALDVASTALACAALVGAGAEAAGAWGRSVWSGDADQHDGPLVVEGAGRMQLRSPGATIDCGNSGTTMRLLAGVLAASRVETVMDGDESLRARPMERVAEPLRRMGALVDTVDGHAPMRVKGAELTGIRHESSVPSAQVKGAVLLAGIGTHGGTEVVERVRTRDHTERALRALGGPVTEPPGEDATELSVAVDRFDVPAFSARVPGDLSSAAYLAGAALVTGGTLVVEQVGGNPTRSRFLDVLARMGALSKLGEDREELGEPLGRLHVESRGLQGTVVGPEELPLIIDEVPLLAAVAAHADGETRFEAAGELRVKESDRLAGIRDLLRGLGGQAAIEGDALIVGGGGLRGGTADSNGDHRMAMAAVVAALAAERPSEIGGAEAAAVSFPGFTATMLDLGVALEVLG